MLIFGSWGGGEKETFTFMSYVYLQKIDNRTLIEDVNVSTGRHV